MASKTTREIFIFIHVSIVLDRYLIILLIIVECF
jgi:hypothetical protein